VLLQLLCHRLLLRQLDAHWVASRSLKPQLDTPMLVPVMLCHAAAAAAAAADIALAQAAAEAA
jgi:hypothetical protein